MGIHQRPALRPEQIDSVKDALEHILNSRQFTSAPAIHAFLKFVINETIAGRGDRLKAYTLATEVFGKNSQFDPANDTIVRTTAGRVRKALDSYYRERNTEPHVVIHLPKGGYVPTFEFRESSVLPTSSSPISPSSPSSPSPTTSPTSTSTASSTSVPATPTSSTQASSTSSPHAPGGVSRLRQFSFQPLTLMAICLFTALVIGCVFIFQWQSGHRSLLANVVINVLPVEYVDQDTRTLARAIDSHLALALRRIGLAEISPPGTHSPTDKDIFVLETMITDNTNPELLWQLIEQKSGLLLWAAKEPMKGMDMVSIGETADKIAFQLLGINGVVPATLSQHNKLFPGASCLFQAQITEAVESDALYPRIRDCLKSIISRAPNDASAWAALSILHTIRSHFYMAGTREERIKLTEQAEIAAERAVELAPEAYLTKVALMRLALRQGRIAEFDSLQQMIRAQYPGDIYLQIHIATRLARLGYGWEALEIFDNAERNFGINLKNWSPGIAVAYFVEGEYEQAYREIARATSNLRFVLVLKAAILGKLNRADEASPIIDQLVTSNPDIKETFYSWLMDIGWTAPLALDIADGLAALDFIVAIDDADNILSLVDDQ